MEPVLRPAHPTPDDAAALARALDVATGGMFRAMFGRRAECILATAVSEPGHEMSLEHAVVAEVDGSVAGVLHGLHARDLADPDPALGRAAGWRMLRAALVEALGRPVFRALGRHDHDELSLIHI